MTELFVKLFNMGITAGWIVLAVLLLRLFLKKAPKWVNCLLWSIVALRLVIPVTFESAFSLIPSAEVIPQGGVSPSSPAIHSGIPTVDGVVNPVLLEHLSEPKQLLAVLSVAWLVGMAALVIYSVASYWKLRSQVRASILRQKNVYICDDVASPFILGIIRPKIYIPSGMDDAQLEYVLAHENAHISRRDHWWKPLGFALLTVYWFHPLLWLAYILLCRDIEQACDEKVIAGLDGAGKKSYSQALLACSAHRRLIMACPVAFGEVSVKARIKGILSYKKPGFWIILTSVLACVVVAVCFLTSPKPCDHEYHGQITVSPTCTDFGVQTFTCEACQYAYTEPVAMLSHTYNEGVITREATCTQQGAKLYTCVDCGNEKTETLEMIPHFGEETYITVEPNCSQQGELSATCASCGAVYVAQVLETNDVHDLKETVLQAATCSAEGQGLLTCTRCDHTEECTYEKLAHNYYNGMTFYGTCAISGYQQRICANCSAEQWVETGTTDDHSWVQMSNGQVRCMRCGDFKVYESNWYSNSSYSQKTDWTGVIYNPSSELKPGQLPSIQIWPQ